MDFASFGNNTSPPPLKLVQEKIPVVVLVGDVGAGKSTLTEKLTNETGLSSSDDKSYTLTSQHYKSPHLIVIDTPGCNSSDDQYEHNIHIAHAFNSGPISLILICIPAQTRLDNTLTSLKQYMEQFIEFEEFLCPVVTMMDTVKWSRELFRAKLKQNMGIENVVFSDVDSTEEDIRKQILSYCHDSSLLMTVDSDNFRRHFKINDENFKILNHIRKEVSRFEYVNRQFEGYIQSCCNESDNLQLLFDYVAFMDGEIGKASKRVSKECNFNEEHPGALERGYTKDLSNQLHLVIANAKSVVKMLQESLLEVRNGRKVSYYNKKGGNFTKKQRKGGQDQIKNTTDAVLKNTLKGSTLNDGSKSPYTDEDNSTPLSKGNQPEKVLNISHPISSLLKNNSITILLPEGTQQTNLEQINLSITDSVGRSLNISINIPVSKNLVSLSAGSNTITSDTNTSDIMDTDISNTNTRDINTNTSNTNTSNTNTSNTNTSNTNTINTNSINTDTINTDTINTDTINTDTINTDTINTDTINTDTIIKTDEEDQDDHQWNPVRKAPIHFEFCIDTGTDRLTITKCDGRSSAFDSSSVVDLGWEQVVQIFEKPKFSTSSTPSQIPLLSKALKYFLVIMPSTWKNKITEYIYKSTNQLLSMFKET